MYHVRLPRSLVKRLDHYCVDNNLDRARGVEVLLGIALAGITGRAE